MKQQRYVLTIQNASVFREIDVSPQMPAMKIGTTPDDAAERLVRTELLLIWMQTDRLREHAREWALAAGDAQGDRSGRLKPSAT